MALGIFSQRGQIAKRVPLAVDSDSSGGIFGEGILAEPVLLDEDGGPLAGVGGVLDGGHGGEFGGGEVELLLAGTEKRLHFAEEDLLVELLDGGGLAGEVLGLEGDPDDLLVLAEGVDDLGEGDHLAVEVEDAADDNNVEVVVLEEVLAAGEDLLDELEQRALLLLADVVLAEEDDAVVDVLEQPLLHRHLHETERLLVAEQLHPRTRLPQLLEKDPLLQLEQEQLQLLRQVGVDAQPVERHEACEYVHAEEEAVLLEGELLGLVGVVEDDGGEAEEGVEVVRVGGDVLEILLPDSAAHFLQEGEEELVDLEAAVRLVLALAADVLQDHRQFGHALLLVVLHVHYFRHLLQQRVGVELSFPAVDFVLDPFEDGYPGLALIDDQLLPSLLHLAVPLLLFLHPEVLEYLSARVHLALLAPTIAVTAILVQLVGGGVLVVLLELEGVVVPAPVDLVRVVVVGLLRVDAVEIKHFVYLVLVGDLLNHALRRYGLYNVYHTLSSQRQLSSFIWSDQQPFRCENLLLKSSTNRKRRHQSFASVFRSISTLLSYLMRYAEFRISSNAFSQILLFYYAHRAYFSNSRLNADLTCSCPSPPPIFLKAYPTNSPRSANSASCGWCVWIWKVFLACRQTIQKADMRLQATASVSATWEESWQKRVRQCLKMAYVRLISLNLAVSDWGAYFQSSKTSSTACRKLSFSVFCTCCRNCQRVTPYLTLTLPPTDGTSYTSARTAAAAIIRILPSCWPRAEGGSWFRKISICGGREGSRVRCSWFSKELSYSTLINNYIFPSMIFQREVLNFGGNS